MKKLFIEAKSNKDIIPVVKKSLKLLKSKNLFSVPNSVRALLKGKIGLVSTVQHAHKLNQAKEFLEKNNIKAVVGGSVLGCNAYNAKKLDADIYLYIGSGEFHPIQIAFETKKQVIKANPLTNKVSKLDNKEVKKLEKRKKGGLLKFLSSKNIGIIVSAKEGQNRLNDAFDFRKKNKNCYVFMADTIDLSQLENFPFIECWVNTACPRLIDDKKGLVNIDDINTFLDEK